jgi:hypothetical protein
MPAAVLLLGTHPAEAKQTAAKERDLVKASHKAANASITEL